MDYQSEYNSKLCTADEAVKVVKSGDWVDYGFCTGTADALDAALAKRMPELEDVKVRGAILMKPAAIYQIDHPEEHFTWNSWHMSGIERRAINAGFSYYAPIRFSELPLYYRDDVEDIQVAMFQVAPMDKFGYFSFGPNATYMTEMCKRADKVIVEVNENMPRLFGRYNDSIHISQVDAIVEGNNPPIGEMPAGGAASEVDQKVAELIVEQIPDGACLQLGIGGMPNAVGSLIAKSDLKHLGVHTEMYVDAYVDMAKAGKIDGTMKNIDHGKQVFAFGAGTKKLYDYIDNNPECLSAPVDYVNNIATISSLDNFVSINNTVDLDLFGQISAETSGTKHISGAGGQLDFVMGAYLSKGGKSFICCSSTFKTKSGELKSRILPTLNPGSAVTDTRANTHYVVTEYGMVNLKGLTTWQRAEALISIAHPDFRQSLIDEAEKMKIWKKGNNRLQY